MKKPAKKPAKKTVEDTGIKYSVTVLGDYIILKKERSTKVTPKRIIRRRPEKIAVRGVARVGCQYKGYSYDVQRDRTTFLYECDHVVNEVTGARYYEEHRDGRPPDMLS